MLRKFLENHVLANVTFAVVLLVGILSYFQLPRAQDPDVNFNWISIITILPGASSEDVEKLVTNPLEEAIQKVQDIKFVASTSREGISDILVRFEDISERIFDKRINDLRREIQNKANAELPDEVEDPTILEITTSNNFPTATLIVAGEANDELLRKTALNVRKDLERIKGVDAVNEAGFAEPELRVTFDPATLRARNLIPSQVANTVRAYFRDVVAGDMKVGSQEWLVRVIGTDADPGYLASLPIIGTNGEITIGDVAQVSWGHDEFSKLSSINGKPGVTLAVTKQAQANIMDLVERINQYIDSRNPVLKQHGLEIILLDDQTETTREAIDIMQGNALLGLVLVMVVTWVFLGSHIAFFIGIGIPFTLAATFWLLNGIGETLNQNVLLAVVIVLGMLVDDAVVVVEAIYYRIQRGAQSMQAAIDALKEVFTPVTASVTTTMAAFLPLMLLPGIVGKFMFVVPFVVSAALAISLFEAYWMLPVHVTMVRLDLSGGGKMQQRRIRFTHMIRVKYSKLLIKVLRRPRASLFAMIGLFILALGTIASGMVRLEFFAFDPMRAFYINVEMPPGTSLQTTMDTVAAIEAKARKHLEPEETRTVSSTAGQMFTDTAPFFGDIYGQVFVSLNADTGDLRSVVEVIEAMRSDVTNTAGPRSITMFKLSKGPPVTKPISIKVRGDNFEELRAATNALQEILRNIPAVTDISDNDSPGKNELKLQLDTDAVQRSGLSLSLISVTAGMLRRISCKAFVAARNSS
ncbi:efflux RND transporter permease subunit, partial [Kaarinaea lacus]